MEKQPIDDLFARKLREAELPPSPDAFSRLQSRMASTELPTTKRRVAMWWWGAAAASLLLVALFYVRNNLNVKQIARQTKSTHTTSPMPKQQAIQLVAKAREDKTHQMVSISAAKNGSDNRQEKIKAVVIKPVAGMEEAKSIATVRKEPVQKAVVQPLETPSVTANNELMAVTTNPPVATQIAQPKLPTTTGRADQQRVVMMTIVEPKEDGSIVALQTTNAESKSQAQSSSLAGLFAKVKQLKNGDVLARATPAKRPTDPRSRLGRVFEGMKESLKNETTLD